MTQIRPLYTLAVSTHISKDCPPQGNVLSYVPLFTQLQLAITPRTPPPGLLSKIAAKCGNMEIFELCYILTGLCITVCPQIKLGKCTKEFNLKVNITNITQSTLSVPVTMTATPPPPRCSATIITSIQFFCIIS